jgi:hypothetical protein
MADKRDYFAHGVLNTHVGKGTPSWQYGKAWRDTIDGIGKMAQQANDQLAAAADTLSKIGRAPQVPLPPPCVRSIEYLPSKAYAPKPNLTSGPAYTGGLSYPSFEGEQGWWQKFTNPFHPDWWMETESMQACQSLARNLEEAGWRQKLFGAFVSAMLVSTIGVVAPWGRSLLANLPLSAGILISAGLGAIIGWMLPFLFSRIIQLGVCGVSWAASAVVWLVAVATVGGIVYGIGIFLARR